MAQFTPAQRKLLEALTFHGVGTTVMVVTSQYADRRVIRANLITEGRPNMPIVTSTAAAVRGLLARGIVTGETLWRCAEVKLVAAVQL